MKKLLSMALMLIMVFSLFAVPTMAAAGNLITNGDFEAFAPDTTSSASTFNADSNTAGSAYTKVIDLNGNKVLQLGSGTGTAQYRANTIDFEAGKTYTISADVYVMVAGSAKGEVKFLNLGTKINPDAEATTEGLTFAAGGSSTSFYIPNLNEWVHIEATITPSTSATKYLQVNFVGGAGATNCAIGYLDDVTITEYVEPTEYDVTITAGENANASVAKAISEGEAVDFTVVPKFGYYIESITIGGTDFGGFEAYTGGTYSTGAISKDTEIVVTVASLADNNKGVSTDVATLPAVFAPAADTAVTFGKVLDGAATEWGIKLTKGGEDVKTESGVGPMFAATSKNANGQFAVEFVGLTTGTYTAQTYVIVGDGEPTYGVATTIVVE